MTKRRRRSFCILPALLASCVALGSVPAHAADDVVIGVVAPLTGPFAERGKQVSNGALAAIDMLNKMGGILGRKIAPLPLDEQCNVPKERELALRLGVSRAVAAIGHVCAEAVGAFPVYGEEKILAVIAGSSLAALTDEASNLGLRTVFRVVGRSDMQGAVAARFIDSRFGNAPIALIEDDSAYGRSLATEFRAVAEAVHLNLVVQRRFAGGDDLAS